MRRSWVLLPVLAYSQTATPLPLLSPAATSSGPVSGTAILGVSHVCVMFGWVHVRVDQCTVVYSCVILKPAPGAVQLEHPPPSVYSSCVFTTHTYIWFALCKAVVAGQGLHHRDEVSPLLVKGYKGHVVGVVVVESYIHTYVLHALRDCSGWCWVLEG